MALTPFFTTPFDTDFDATLSTMLNRSLFGGGSFFGVAPSLPMNDIRDAGRHYEVCVGCPGMTAKDVTVEQTDRFVCVCGERKSSRRQSRFARTFTLPPDADPQKLHASVANGVLTLEIAKRPLVERPLENVRRIQVHDADTRVESDVCVLGHHSF
jgi:HSP20 family molecular chaperone IbpA